MKIYRIITECIEAELLSELNLMQREIMDELTNAKVQLIEGKLWYDKKKEMFCATISYYDVSILKMED